MPVPILPYGARVPKDDPNQFAILTFDPGGTIGWARLILNVRAFSRPGHKVLANLLSWDCGEFTGPEAEQLERAVSLIRATRQNGSFIRHMNIVAEGFELTQMIGGDNLLSPVRINAVLDWECRKLGLKLSVQRRHMRTNITGERLRLCGFHGRWSKTGTGKDAFAAMQHAVVWARRLKQESIGRPWKLSDSVSSNAYWDCACSEGGSDWSCDLDHPR